jgi:predicted enzyme related to lactoylglutathione lyase
MFALTNGVAWFEIGSDQPDAAEKFYGELFSWQFSKVLDITHDYRAIKAPGQSIVGALVAAGGDIPTYATFGVIVDDVHAICRRAEEAGGRVAVQPVTYGPSGMTFAYLADPSGNLFGISSLPDGADV